MENEMNANYTEIVKQYPNAELVRGRWQSHEEIPQFIDATFETEAEARAAADATDGTYHAEGRLTYVIHVVTWLNAEYREE